MKFTREQEIGQIRMGRPHVLILGAGTSFAALPEGDANGKPLPLMNNLIKLLGLENILAQIRVPFEGRNFEDVYAEVHRNHALRAVKEEIEDRIFDYFSSLELPNEPTIYDFLVLCLRDKDIIATFNWDPFLIQAYRRNAGTLSLPRLLFLHGNVMVACCAKDKVMGLKGNLCTKCGQLLTPTRLLYPVTEKNYEADPMISAQWTELRSYMKNAFMFTVFGYSAPKSDVSAIELLKDGWGSSDQRVMEETEIIDIKPEEELTEVWDSFINSHHISVSSDFFDSWLARHPRRTGEVYMAQFFDTQFVEGNPVPKDVDLIELQQWFLYLHDVEATDKGE